MSGLSDSITVGILLMLVFGAFSFYLYSRINQAERRVSLLENLLMDLKMSTEAAFTGADLRSMYTNDGPTSVHPVSEGSPLSSDDVEPVKEEDYEALLASALPSNSSNVDAQLEESPRSAQEFVQPLSDVTPKQQMDVNYESMTLKELQALARERGLSVTNQRKREMIDALKKSATSTSETPLESVKETNELPGASVGKEGYSVQLEL